MYLHVYNIIIFIIKDLVKTANRDSETFSKGARKLTGFKTSKGCVFQSNVLLYVPM